MDVTPKVGIVILNWNNPSDTLECLASINELEYDDYFVVVVDNGSRDDSINRISRSYPAVELISLPSNIGYAGGNNKGISTAIARGAEYIFILNNDTVVSHNCLKELISTITNNQKIGMVGPRIYCMHPPDLLYSTGSYIKWNDGETAHRGLFQPDTRVLGDHIPEPVDFLAGCAILIHKKLYETIGGLDEAYFLNFEDTEWAIRAKRNGFEVWYVPQAIIRHKVSATLGLSSPANTYYMTRNSLRFFWTNSIGLLKLKTVSKILYRTIRTVFAWTIYRKYKQSAYFDKRSANLFAIRDFFIGRYGSMGPDVSKICNRD